MEFTDQSDDVEELSKTTIAVLLAICLFIVSVVLFYSFSLAWRIPWRRRRHAKKPQSRPEREALNNGAKLPHPSAMPKPQKPGVSLKQLVKNAQQATSRQVASDKPVDHPLYITAIRACHDSITGLSFNASGTELAVACEDRVLRVFNMVEDGAKQFSFKRKELLRDLVDVAFGAGNELFVLSKGGIDLAVLEKYELASSTGRGDPFSLVWELKDVHGKEAGKGLRAASNIRGRSIALSYTSKSDLQLLSHSGSHLASVNSSEKGIQGFVFPELLSEAVAISAKICSATQIRFVWGGVKERLQNHDVALSRGGRFLGAATFTSDVRLFEVQYTREGDLKRVAKVMDLKRAHNGQVLALAFSPDEKRVVTASKDGTWAVWNIDVRYNQIEDPKILLKKEQEIEGDERYGLLAFGTKDRVAASFGNTLHFLDARQGTLLEQIEDAHEGPITAIEWSPMPQRYGEAIDYVLVTSSTDKRIRLWRAPLV